MSYTKKFLSEFSQKYSNEVEFIQAVEEVLSSISDFIDSNKKYKDYRILERITEPDRSISFRVTWQNDNNEIVVNRGYRVNFNNALGPYKGGLRFHPTVNLSILKFLAFEQTFKNSLTGLPLGGGKGGSDFDPKGKSENEIMRFCQSFVTELYRHIGPDTDVPAGDIGVSTKEIGYMFGHYKRITNSFTGTFTGKGINWGGSWHRPEATGYGLVYFVNEMLENINEGFSGKNVVISGSGNVAQYAAEKVIQLGGKVITMSDSSGFIYDKDGIDMEKLEFIKTIKNLEKERISEYAKKYNAKFIKGKKPWNTECNITLPCATQNEIDLKDAKSLVKNRVLIIGEGANMPTSNEAVSFLIANKVLLAPGKASNAGGVAVSGLEMSQNSQRLQWDKNDVDLRLKKIMKNIHKETSSFGKEVDYINYIKGANISGFTKLADAMIDQGIV